MALERMFLIKFLTETEDAQRGAMALGASLLSIPSAALWAGSTVESTMARVDTAIVAAGANTAELGARFADLGKDASTMLNVSEMAAKMGIQGADNLEKFATVASKMGTATGVGAEAAGGSLSRMGLAMDYNVEQMEKLASGMVALSSKTMVSASALESVIVRLGPMAKEAGIGEPVIMALAAAFEQHGLKARQAIMPLTRFIEMMTKGVVPGQQLARSVGITGEEFEKWKAAKPEQRLEMFSAALAKMDPDKAKKKLVDLKIGTKMYGAQTLAAMKDTKGLSRMLGIASEGMADNSALNEEAAQVQATLSEQLKSLWTSLKAVGGQVGLIMIPFVKIFVGVLQGLVSVLSLVPKPILAVVAALSAFVGAILTGVAVSQIQFVKASMAMIASSYKMAKVAYLVVAGEYAKAHAMSLTMSVQQRTTASLIGSRIAQLKAASAGGVLAQVQTILGWIGFKVGASQIAGAAGMTAMSGASAASVPATTAGAAGVTTLWAALGPLALIAFAVTAAIVGMVLIIKKAIGLWKKGGDGARTLSLYLLMLVGPIGLMIAGFLLFKSVLKPIFDEILAPFIEVAKAIKTWAKQQEWLMSILRALVPVLKVIAIVIIAAFFWPIAIIVGLLWVIAKLVGWLHKTVKAAWTVGIVLAIAFAPVTAILLPIISLIWLIIKAVQWLTGALAGSGLEEAWRFVAAAFKFFINVVMTPMKFLLRVVKTMIAALSKLASVAKTVGSVVAKPFTAAKEGAKGAIGWVVGLAKTMGSAIASGAKKVWGAIFGSSFLHIAEGTAEVMPSLLLLAKLFGVISKAAVPPPIGGAPGAARAATIGGAIPTAGALAAGAMSPRAPAVAAAAATVAARAAATRPTIAKITVPVTVALDGMVLARALSEYLVELHAERNMNEPGYPLRGVEPAY